MTSRAQFTCINPCNQFLIQYLLKLRQKQAHSKLIRNHHRNDHQFHIYTRAMDSIKKYPLPIICQDQLNILAGIGDCLCRKLIEVVKQHYRQFLKGVKQEKGIKQEQAQLKQRAGFQKQIKQYAKNGGQSVKTLNWVSQNSSIKSIKSDIHSDNSDYNQQNKDKINQFAYSSKFQSDNDSKSIKFSQQYKKNLIYKPRQGSQSSIILKILKNLNANINSVTKKDIDKYILENNNYQKIKQWKNNKDILIKNGYIEIDPSLDYQAYFLTAKGEQFITSNQQQQMSNITKKKMQSQISYFKLQYIQKQRQQEQASISIALSLQSAQYSQTSNNFSMHSLNSYKIDHTVFRKPLILKPQQKLIIVIDTRQMKDQSQRAYFQQTLIQKYNIDVITHSLTIGDFVFCYDGYVLDYIIQRKKADDLGASIIDGRYRQQKMRLKNCGASNVIYLYQGYPSQNSVLKQKQLQKALFTTRVSQGFKIIKTSKTNQTVKLLSQLHSQIQKKINNQPQSVYTIGTLQQFNRRNTKNKYLTVQNIFGLCLKTFPNVGKQTVVNILRYFKSFYLLYTQLQKYQNNLERVQFLNGLLKGGRTQAGVTSLIVDFLFGFQEKQRQKVQTVSISIQSIKQQKVRRSQSQ